MSHTKKEGPAGNRTALRVTDATSNPSVTTAADTTPQAPIISVIPGDSTRLVYIRCPFCGKKHQHGWPYGEANPPGLRISSCSHHVKGMLNRTYRVVPGTVR